MREGHVVFPSENRIMKPRDKSLLVGLAMLLAASWTSLPWSIAVAAVIHVPSQEPTIQAGADAASHGDTVLVAPGIYVSEGNTDIQFWGKDIVVRSHAGPDSTIIDLGYQSWGHQGFVIQSGEGPSAVIEGFTIANANAQYVWGGAIAISNSSPTIRNCVFVSNTSAMHLSESSAGGAVLVAGDAAAPTVVDCVFSANFVSSSNGASGGAVFCYQGCAPVFVRCTFVSNHADAGGAILNAGASLTLEECTFHGNEADLGAAVYTELPAEITNSIIVFNQGGEPVYSEEPDRYTLICCDIYGNTGGDWVGHIAPQYGINGNISLDPLFCDAANGDFTLDASSPCAPEHSGGCGLIGAWPVGCGTTSIGTFETPPLRTLLTVLPNPVLNRATFVLDTGSGASKLEIYDPQGRLVDLLTASGRVDWSPARDAISGVYFARLRGGRESAVVKFVVLK